MNPSIARQEELFAAALALPPAERPGYLARECLGDAELQRRMANLLRAHETAGRRRQASANSRRTAIDKTFTLESVGPVSAFVPMVIKPLR